MAYDENSMDMMANGGEEEMPAKEEESSAETALVPKTAFGAKSPEPGETVTMKVVHVYEDEVEVEFVNGDSGKMPEDEMASADRELEGAVEMPA